MSDDAHHLTEQETDAKTIKIPLEIALDSLFKNDVAMQEDQEETAMQDQFREMEQTPLHLLMEEFSALASDCLSKVAKRARRLQKNYEWRLHLIKYAQHIRNLRRAKDPASVAEVKLYDAARAYKETLNKREQCLLVLSERFQEEISFFCHHEEGEYQPFCDYSYFQKTRVEALLDRLYVYDKVPNTTARRFCREVGDRVRTKPVYMIGLCNRPMKIRKVMYHEQDFLSWFFNRDVRNLLSPRMQKVVAERRRACIRYQIDLVDCAPRGQLLSGELENIVFSELRTLRRYLVRAETIRVKKGDRETREKVRVLMRLVLACLDIMKYNVDQSSDWEMLGSIHALGSEHEDKEGRMELSMIKSTEDLRGKLIAIFEEIEAGKISNTTARVKVAAAKAILDTVKIEIAAAQLGKQFSSVSFSDNGEVIEKPVFRIA